MNLQQLNSKLEKMEAVLKANEEQIAVLNKQNGILKSNISEVKKLQKKYESIEADLEKKIESLNLMDLDLKPKRRTKPKKKVQADVTENAVEEKKTDDEADISKYFNH